MKKSMILCAMLVALSLSFAFTGCGSKSNDSKSETETKNETETKSESGSKSESENPGNNCAYNCPGAGFGFDLPENVQLTKGFLHMKDIGDLDYDSGVMMGWPVYRDMTEEEYNSLTAETIGQANVGEVFDIICVKDVNSEEEAKDALRAMKYDNKTKAAVAGILRYKDKQLPADRIRIKQALNQMGEEIFFLTLDLQEAITRAQMGGLSKCQDDVTLSTFALVREMAEDIIAKKEPYTISQLAVNGNDLMQAGIPEGTQLNEKLEGLLNLVIRDPENNTKEQLMKWLRTHN